MSDYNFGSGATALDRSVFDGFGALMERKVKESQPRPVFSPGTTARIQSQVLKPIKVRSNKRVCISEESLDMERDLNQSQGLKLRTPTPLMLPVALGELADDRIEDSESRTPPVEVLGRDSPSSPAPDSLSAFHEREKKVSRQKTPFPTMRVAVPFAVRPVSPLRLPPALRFREVCSEPSTPLTASSGSAFTPRGAFSAAESSAYESGPDRGIESETDIEQETGALPSLGPAPRLPSPPQLGLAPMQFDSEEPSPVNPRRLISPRTRRREERRLRRAAKAKGDAQLKEAGKLSPPQREDSVLQRYLRAPQSPTEAWVLKAKARARKRGRAVFEGDACGSEDESTESEAGDEDKAFVDDSELHSGGVLPAGGVRQALEQAKTPDSQYRMLPQHREVAKAQAKGEVAELCCECSGPNAEGDCKCACHEQEQESGDEDFEITAVKQEAESEGDEDRDSFIEDFKAAHGYSPTEQQVDDAVNDTINGLRYEDFFYAVPTGSTTGKLKLCVHDDNMEGGTGTRQATRKEEEWYLEQSDSDEDT